MLDLMGHDHAAPEGPSTIYSLQLRGPLPAGLADDLDGFTVDAGPTTTLIGPLTDDAELYGLIARLERLGLTLLSIVPTPPRATTMQSNHRDDVAPISLSEHSQLLLAAHRAMRADGARLIGATRRLRAGDPGDARALGSAFAEIVTLIHDHHWAEDDVMYPFLAAHVPTFEHEAVQLERDHIDLDAAMARITAGLRLLAGPATQSVQHDTQQRLEADARTFNDILVDHLDREEATIVTPFESTISPAEQRTLSRAESKLGTYRHIRMAVPWVLANTSAGEATELRRVAPRIIGILHDHLWQRRFRRVMAPLYGAT